MIRPDGKLLFVQKATEVIVPGRRDRTALLQQLRNRELATERVIEQLREATKVRRKRTATKPTKASKERRLDEKKRRGRTKQLRRSTED